MIEYKLSIIAPKSCGVEWIRGDGTYEQIWELVETERSVQLLGAGTS